MGKCARCGNATGFMMEMCDSCLSAHAAATGIAPTREAPTVAAAPDNTRAGTLVTVGMLCLAFGVYFLLINPSSPSVDFGALGAAGELQRGFVNLQKLAIGMASAIAGAIFLTGGVLAWQD
jgi:hypothetical protein